MELGEEMRRFGAIEDKSLAGAWFLVLDDDQDAQDQCASAKACVRQAALDSRWRATCCAGCCALLRWNIVELGGTWGTNLAALPGLLRAYSLAKEREATREKTRPSGSVSTLSLRIIVLCTRTFRAMSRLRLQAVLPRRAEDRFRFIIELTVSSWLRCV